MQRSEPKVRVELFQYGVSGLFFAVARVITISSEREPRAESHGMTTGL